MATVVMAGTDADGLTGAIVVEGVIDGRTNNRSPQESTKDGGFFVAKGGSRSGSEGEGGKDGEGNYGIFHGDILFKFTSWDGARWPRIHLFEKYLGGLVGDNDDGVDFVVVAGGAAEDGGNART